MPDEDRVDEWIENSFLEMSADELLREREQPMSDSTRALLEREIAARGMDPLPPSTRPNTGPRNDLRERTLRLGVWMLLVVAALSLTLGVGESLEHARRNKLSYGDLAERRASERVVFEGERMRVSEIREELASRKYFALGFGAGLAVIYATLAMMARGMPRTALALALVVHVLEARSSLGLHGTLEPALLAFPMLVAVGLIYALGRTLTMPPPGQEEEERYWEAWE